MWRHVAADLAADHTVICPDLRGYGASDKPADGYSKRRMAADVVALAAALGHERFALAGHDRGALVAFRAGLDHPGRSPTWPAWTSCRPWTCGTSCAGASAAVGWHLFLMAQPPGLPETMIAADPDTFFAHFLDQWVNDPGAIDAAARAAYLAASREAIPSIVADYRASAGIDVDHDTADRAAGSEAGDAGDGRPAGLGRRPRLRRRRALAGLGRRPPPPHHAGGPLHGRGGARPRSSSGCGSCWPADLAIFRQNSVASSTRGNGAGCRGVRHDIRGQAAGGDRRAGGREGRRRRHGTAAVRPSEGGRSTGARPSTSG